MFKNSLTLLLSRCGAWFLSPPVLVVYSDLLLTNRIMQSSSVWFPKLNRTSHYGFLFVVPLVSLGAWGNQWPCHKNIPAVLHGEEMSLLTKNPWDPPANSHVRWSPWKWTLWSLSYFRWPQPKTTSWLQLLEWLSEWLS